MGFTLEKYRSFHKACGRDRWSSEVVLYQFLTLPSFRIIPEVNQLLDRKEGKHGDM
jgi:hypothetical protein